MLVSSAIATRDDAPVIEIRHEFLLILIHLLFDHTIILNFSPLASF
jgi:hypothetical protein